MSKKSGFNLAVCTIVIMTCSHAFAVTIDVNKNGVLQTLGQAPQKNFLEEPLRMRILERKFSKQAKVNRRNETDRKVVVANQSDLFDSNLHPATKRELCLIIDAAKIKPKSLKRKDGSATVYKSYRKGKLSWESVFEPKGNGLELAVTFKNESDNLRSFDVEFYVPLKGVDYKAFFPGQNDFPEWPDGTALGYGIRTGEWGYNRLSQPLGTFFSKQRDVGFSIASSYNRPILPITFFAARSKTHTTVLVTFVRVRLDPKGERTIRLYMVPHAGDWREGLAFVRKTFPKVFYVNPEVSKFFTYNFGGSGALGGYYPECLNNPRLWKNYMDLFNPWGTTVVEMMEICPWQGLYASDVPEWISACDKKWYFVNKFPEWFPKEFMKGKPAEDASWQEIVKWLKSRPEHLKEKIFKKGRNEDNPCQKYYWQKLTNDKVREFIRVAKKHNSYMFLYWNPRDNWYPYAKDKFEDLIVYRSKNYFNFDCAYVSAAKGSNYFNGHLEQFRRMFREYPELDGYFVDQSYGAAGNVYNYDDGYTVTDDGRTASCFNSNLAELNSAGRKIAHEYGKFTWGNHIHETIDIPANYDLGLVEGNMTVGANGGRYSTIGNRPCISLQVDERIHQACLRNGMWTDMWMMGDHDDYNERLKGSCIYWRSRLYAPLFDLFRSRTWVLEPHCLSLPDGFEGNLFRIDNENNLLATIVAFGESYQTPWLRLNVPVTIKTSDAHEVKAAYVVGVANLGAFKVPFERNGDTITVKIPQFRSAACVLFAKKGKFVSVDSALPVIFAGGTFNFNIIADNFTDETWSWKNTVWIGNNPKWHWEEIPANQSVRKTFSLSSDNKKPFVQMRLAKDVASRLPIEDGIKNHISTFEFFVKPQVSVTLAPSRALVKRTLSNSTQGGYKPFYAVNPLHLCEGETAEFTLGVINNSSAKLNLTAKISGKNINIQETPESMQVQPQAQRNFKVLVRGSKRGAGSIHVDLKDGNRIVSTFDLPIQVFGTHLSQADLSNVKSVSLLYDIWGRTKVGGADAKTIRINKVPVGPLVGGDGFPIWYSRIRAKLNEQAVKALKTQNLVSITNPGTAFWKIRNVILEVNLVDGSVVHLKADPGAISFPKAHFMAEGKKHNTNMPVKFSIPAVNK